MIAVIFEVTLDDDRAPRYFDLAAALKPELEQVDGFISVERFQSLVNEGKYVSLSFWRDRAAVEAWYRMVNHKAAQEEGRAAIGPSASPPGGCRPVHVPTQLAACARLTG